MRVSYQFLLVFGILSFSFLGCSGSGAPIIATESTDDQANAAFEAEMKSVEDAERANDAQFKKASKR